MDATTRGRSMVTIGTASLASMGGQPVWGVLVSERASLVVALALVGGVAATSARGHVIAAQIRARVSEPVDAIRPRRGGPGGVRVALWLLVVGVSIGLHPLLGVAAGGAGAASLWRRTRGFKRREEFRHRRELADVAVLLGVGLASGLPIVAAIDATAELGRSETARRLSVVGRSIVAGETLSGALDRWTLAVGGRASDLAAILGDIERGGTGARARLEHLVDSLARDEQLALAEHARKTPVLMLVPLVTCVLPAFAAVTVIPVILAALGRLHVG